MPSCSLLVKRLHAGLEACVEGFGCGLCGFVCSSASACLAFVGGPGCIVGPGLCFVTWLLLLPAGIRWLELNREEDSKGRTAFRWTKPCDGMGREKNFQVCCRSCEADETPLRDCFGRGEASESKSCWARGGPSPTEGHPAPLFAPLNAARGLGDSSALGLARVLESDGVSASDGPPGCWKCSSLCLGFLTTALTLAKRIQGHQAANPALQVLPGCLACRNALLLSADTGVWRGQGAMLISFGEADDSASWVFRVLPFKFWFVAVGQRGHCCYVSGCF